MNHEQLLRAGVGLATLEAIGFESAHQSSLVSKIRRISPNGGTAMRDSVMAGIKMMLKLYAFLVACDIADTWNFVHVVLTDGEDNKSETSLGETCDLMKEISGVIPVEMLKTYFIGIDLGSVGTKEINTLVKSGGGNAQFINVSDANIDQIFKQLTFNIGLVQRTQARKVPIGDDLGVMVTQENYTFMSVKKQNYVVLFNLDISGSMETRWNRVCNSVSGFIDQMGSLDLVAGLVFNTEVKLITTPSPPTKQGYLLTTQTSSREANQLTTRVQREQNYQVNPQRVISKRSCEDYINMFFILLLCLLSPIFYCCVSESAARYNIRKHARISALFGLIGNFIFILIAYLVNAE